MICALGSIPVVVLTSSGLEEDVLRSYSLHANAYITKLVNHDQFFKAIHQSTASSSKWSACHHAEPNVMDLPSSAVDSSEVQAGG